MPGSTIHLGKDAEDQGRGPQSVAGLEHELDVLLSSTDPGINLASLAELG